LEANSSSRSVSYTRLRNALVFPDEKAPPVRRTFPRQVLEEWCRGVAGVYNRAKHEAAKRYALEVWGAHVMALVEGQKPGKVLLMRGKR
jgi:hypothetical protein